MPKPREIIMGTVGNETVADMLLPQAVANQKRLPIEDEKAFGAWAAGAAVVNSFVKSGDRRAVSDQLWRLCAADGRYPVELRTVYGGSDHAHSAEVLDWALPSLAIAAAMEPHGVSPKVSILSADEASIRVNGLDPARTRRHTDDTLELVRMVGERHYPEVRLEVERLSWEELVADPYDTDVEMLQGRRLGVEEGRIVDTLEEKVSQRGGDPLSVVVYLALHNTAYGIYSSAPVVKMAGTPEARFSTVQGGLASRHPERLATIDMANTPRFVSGIISGTSSTPPYYLRTGAMVPDVLERMRDMDAPLSIIAKEQGLGPIVASAAALHPGLQGALV